MGQLAGSTKAFPNPGAVASFRFGRASLDRDGHVALEYALDDGPSFVERVDIPVDDPGAGERAARAQPLVDLLHWVAGISYYKAAIPPVVSFAGRTPPPAAAQLLDALYSEGLAEFAVRNGVDLPHPEFPTGSSPPPLPHDERDQRLLVPVGGGKDSIVAIEALRTLPADIDLFSVGSPAPVQATVAVAGLPWLCATRRLDPSLLDYNAHGALNGHVPVTAIVSCIAALTAFLNGHSAVVMANERSASHGNLDAYGIEVNHQFSKGLKVERLLRSAVREATGGPAYFSVLRGASELLIARAFARLTQYHGAFTSCNAVFRLDELRRASSWCGDCPKCRFVFLALAAFMSRPQVEAIFGGRNLLEDAAQYDDFALLAAEGGHKPFECVGEEEEAIAAFRLLARDPSWRDAAVVQRFAREVLPRLPSAMGDPASVLEWSSDHDIPPAMAVHVRDFLGA
jgi:UDP-N-acetyl-alpha-D-muramoyl-L-alanyl-L-glutamate epimerase